MGVKVGVHIHMHMHTCMHMYAHARMHMHIWSIHFEHVCQHSNARPSDPHHHPRMPECSALDPGPWPNRGAQLTLSAGRKAVLAIAIAVPPPRNPPPGVVAADAGAAAPCEDGTLSVEWDWAVEGLDVDFGARFVPSGGVAVEVVPVTRHFSSVGPVEGQFVVPPGCKRGVLEITFSNYYSYLRSKTVSYRLTLPDGVTAPTPRIV